MEDRVVLTKVARGRRALKGHRPYTPTGNELFVAHRATTRYFRMRLTADNADQTDVFFLVGEKYITDCFYKAQYTHISKGFLEIRRRGIRRLRLRGISGCTKNSNGLHSPHSTVRYNRSRTLSLSPFMWGAAGTLMTSPESSLTSRSSQDVSRTFSGFRSVWMSLIECRNSIACPSVFSMPEPDTCHIRKNTRTSGLKHVCFAYSDRTG